MAGEECEPSLAGQRWVQDVEEPMVQHTTRRASDLRHIVGHPFAPVLALLSLLLLGGIGFTGWTWAGQLQQSQHNALKQQPAREFIRLAENKTNPRGAGPTRQGEGENVDEDGMTLVTDGYQFSFAVMVNTKKAGKQTLLSSANSVVELFVDEENMVTLNISKLLNDDCANCAVTSREKMQPGHKYDIIVTKTLTSLCLKLQPDIAGNMMELQKRLKNAKDVEGVKQDSSCITPHHLGSVSKFSMALAGELTVAPGVEYQQLGATIPISFEVEGLDCSTVVSTKELESTITMAVEVLVETSDPTAIVTAKVLPSAKETCVALCNIVVSETPDVVEELQYLKGHSDYFKDLLLEQLSGMRVSTNESVTSGPGTPSKRQLRPKIQITKLSMPARVYECSEFKQPPFLNINPKCSGIGCALLCIVDQGHMASILEDRINSCSLVKCGAGQSKTETPPDPLQCKSGKDCEEKCCVKSCQSHACPKSACGVKKRGAKVCTPSQCDQVCCKMPKVPCCEADNAFCNACKQCTSRAMYCAKLGLKAHGYPSCAADFKMPCETPLKMVFALSSHVPLRGVAAFADARRAVTAGDDGRAWIWEIRSGVPQVLLQKNNSGPITAVATTSDGTSVITASGGSSAAAPEVNTWDGYTGKILSSLPQESKAVSGTAFYRVAWIGTSTGNRAIYWNWGGGNRTFFAPRYQSKEELEQKYHEDVEEAFQHTDQSERLDVAAYNAKAVNATATRYANKAYSPLAVLPPNMTMGPVGAATFLPGSSGYVVGDKNGSMYYFDRRTLLLRSYVPKAHDGAVNAIVATPTQQMVVSGGEDGVVRVWSLNGPEGFQVREFVLNFAGAVRSLTLLPGGKELFVGSDDDHIRSINIDTGIYQCKITTNGGPTNGLANNPGCVGQIIAASNDGIARVYGP